jgi:hypothetical protein
VSTFPSAAKPPRAPLIILISAVVVFAVTSVWFGLPEVRFAAEQGRVSRARMHLASFLHATEAYRTTFGSLPEGTPAEIAASLLGANPESKVFLEVTADRTNAQGAFVDPWGTAWEIWKAGENRLDARSAGPNRRFGDHDDLVASRAVASQPPASPSPEP